MEFKPSGVATMAAWLAPLSAVPSAAWRIGTLAGVYGETHPVTIAMRSEPRDVLLLSFGSVLLLSLTIGLVRTWGEEFPKWLGPIGGKRVPPLLALGPAYLGGAFLSGLALFAILRMLLEAPTRELVLLEGSDLLVVQLAYTPLLLTGALVLVAARDYHRRVASSRFRERGL